MVSEVKKNGQEIFFNIIFLIDYVFYIMVKVIYLIFNLNYLINVLFKHFMFVALPSNKNECHRKHFYMLARN